MTASRKLESREHRLDARELQRAVAVLEAPARKPAPSAWRRRAPGTRATGAAARRAPSPSRRTTHRTPPLSFAAEPGAANRPGPAGVSVVVGQLPTWHVPSLAGSGDQQCALAVSSTACSAVAWVARTGRRIVVVEDDLLERVPEDLVVGAALVAEADRQERRQRLSDAELCGDRLLLGLDARPAGRPAASPVRTGKKATACSVAACAPAGAGTRSAPCAPSGFGAHFGIARPASTGMNARPFGPPGRGRR